MVECILGMWTPLRCWRRALAASGPARRGRSRAIAYEFVLAGLAERARFGCRGLRAWLKRLKLGEVELEVGGGVAFDELPDRDGAIVDDPAAVGDLGWHLGLPESWSELFP